MSEGPYVLDIDLGTGSVRVGIFDLEGTSAVFAAEAYSLKHPHSGWAEQDPDEWWSCLVKATRRALEEGNLSREGRWSLSGRHDLYRRGPRPAGEGLQTGDHGDGRLTSLIVSPADPGEEGGMEEDAVPTTA